MGCLCICLCHILVPSNLPTFQPNLLSQTCEPSTCLHTCTLSHPHSLSPSLARSLSFSRTHIFTCTHTYTSTHSGLPSRENASRHRSPDTPPVDNGPFGVTSPFDSPAMPREHSGGPASLPRAGAASRAVSPISSRPAAHSRNAASRNVGADTVDLPHAGDESRLDAGHGNAAPGLRAGGSGGGAMEGRASARGAAARGRDRDPWEDSSGLDVDLGPGAAAAGDAAAERGEEEAEGESRAEEVGWEDEDGVPDDHTLEALPDLVSDAGTAGMLGADSADAPEHLVEASGDPEVGAPDVGASAVLRQVLARAPGSGAADAASSGGRQGRVCIGGRAVVLDAPVGVARESVQLRGARGAIVMGRIVLEASAAGHVHSLKLVRMHASLSLRCNCVHVSVHLVHASCIVYPLGGRRASVAASLRPSLSRPCHDTSICTGQPAVGAAARHSLTADPTDAAGVDASVRAGVGRAVAGDMLRNSIVRGRGHAVFQVGTDACNALWRRRARGRGRPGIDGRVCAGAG